jgi:PleD family two-component response regulator
MLGLKPTTTTIMLVAASELRRNLLAQQLEALGYSVIAVNDQPTLAEMLRASNYDLLVVDLSSNEQERTRALSQYVAELMAQGTPMLMLTADRHGDSEVWTQETLSYRVSAALRNRNATDVLSERAVRYEGLNILDEQTMLFSRRYFDAIFPSEIERSKRVHQPMTLLLIELGSATIVLPSLLRDVSARLITSLRQTDLIVRWSEHAVLVLLPVTEAALARAVAARLLKTLSAIKTETNEFLTATIGIATYPQHGITTDTLISAVSHAINHAEHAGQIISFDQV